MSHELYKKYRPQTFDDVIGQPDAVRVLKDMVARRKVPHAILFAGSSGCGKTTLGRILRRAIGCADCDYNEVNVAEARGIDDMRAIQTRMGLAPMGIINGKPGRCRVWLMDEFHQATRQSQECLLKPLEDTPKHVYFFLASTDPGKIITTIKGRCTEIKIKPVAATEMEAYVADVAGKESLVLGPGIANLIAATAEGNVRRALVLLDAIAGLKDPAEQATAIAAADYKTEGINIARALFDRRTTWKDMAAIIKALDGGDDQIEGIRWLVMGYCTSILLSGKQDDRAFLINDVFRRPFYDTKKNGLVNACYEVITSGSKK